MPLDPPSLGGLCPHNNLLTTPVPIATKHLPTPLDLEVWQFESQLYLIWRCDCLSNNYIRSGCVTFWVTIILDLEVWLLGSQSCLTYPMQLEVGDQPQPPLYLNCEHWYVENVSSTGNDSICLTAVTGLLMELWIMHQHSLISDALMDMNVAETMGYT